MHENFRNAFSIKPEDNHDASKWQHLRSERRALAFFSLYAKMNFDKLENENDFYLPKSFSFLVHEFKKGFLEFGISKTPTLIDMFFDTDSCLPVYVIQITLSPLSSIKEVKNINISLCENLSIINCKKSKYVANHKKKIEDMYVNNTSTKSALNTEYCIYVDIVYEDAPDEPDESINLVEIMNQKDATKRILSGKYDPKLGTVSSDKCRPVYAKLIP